MIVKRLKFFGQDATHACDGRCDKAWGNNTRPRVPARTPGYQGDPEDDYAFKSDGELGIAPADPGTYEGGHGKPSNARGPEDINKWCVRECERTWLSPPGSPNATPELPDFSVRQYNVAPHERDPRPAEPTAASVMARSADKLRLALALAATAICLAESSGADQRAVATLRGILSRLGYTGNRSASPNVDPRTT